MYGQTFRLLVFRDYGWWRFRHLPLATRVDRDGSFALKTPVLQVVLKRVVVGVSRRVTCGNCEGGGFCQWGDKHYIVGS